MQLLAQFCRFLSRRFCLSAIPPVFRSFYSDYPVAKLRKPEREGISQKFRQFEIPAVSVKRDNVDQIVNGYIKNTPQYDFTNFDARWSVAIP